MNKNLILSGASISPEAISDATVPTIDPTSTAITPIIGLESIDRIIHGLAPHIKRKQPAQIKAIGTTIHQYLFATQSGISQIAAITNADAAEFIEGIGILIQEEQISDIQALQAHFNIYISQFNPCP